MDDDRSGPDVDDADEPDREDVLDKYDDAVISADDTGMLSGERLITEAESALPLSSSKGQDDSDPKGDV